MTAILIGTVVGAGFASGQEISLYFSSRNILSPMVAGIVFGLLTYLFLMLGYTGKSAIFERKIFKTIIIIASAIIFVAMCAGASEILSGIVTGGGLISAAAAIAVALGGIRFIERFNFICTIIIIGLCVVVCVMGGKINVTGGSGVISAIGYAAMNMLTAGYILSKTGKNMNRRSIALSGILSAVVMTVLIIILYWAITGITGTMPFLIAAKNSGIGAAATAVIFLAILTTQIFVASIILDPIRKKYGTGIAAGFTAALAFSSLLLNFRDVVTYGYPFISVLGIAVTIAALISLFNLSKVRKRFTYKLLL